MNFLLILVASLARASAWLTTMPPPLLVSVPTVNIRSIFSFSQESEWTDAPPSEDNEWNSQSAWSDSSDSNSWMAARENGEGNDAYLADDAASISDELEAEALMSLLQSEPEVRFIEGDELADALRQSSRVSGKQLTDPQLAVVDPLAAAAVRETTQDISVIERRDDEEKAVSTAETQAEAKDQIEVQAFVDVAESGEAKVLNDARLGVVDSHELVELDAQGEPYEERFVFVDEHNCIGCTMCAGVAPATFFMEEEHGRARVFQQQGDANSVVSEALDTCPVDCVRLLACLLACLLWETSHCFLIRTNAVTD